jgi:hypothetical protein
MTEKIDLWGEVLRVSTVVSAAKNEDEQTILLAGELERVVNAATNEIEAERDLAIQARDFALDEVDNAEEKMSALRAERDLAIQTREGALDAQADVEKRMFALRAERDAWERDCEAVATALGYRSGEWVSTALAREVARLRAELAALRAAVEVRLASKNVLEANDAERRLRAVAKDTAAAAEAHDRETEAKALEEAADGFNEEIAHNLRSRAAEIRRR